MFLGFCGVIKTLISLFELILHSNTVSTNGMSLGWSYLTNEKQATVPSGANTIVNFTLELLK